MCPCPVTPSSLWAALMWEEARPNARNHRLGGTRLPPAHMYPSMTAVTSQVTGGSALRQPKALPGLRGGQGTGTRDTLGSLKRSHLQPQVDFLPPLCHGHLAVRNSTDLSRSPPEREGQGGAQCDLSSHISALCRPCLKGVSFTVRDSQNL